MHRNRHRSRRARRASGAVPALLSLTGLVVVFATPLVAPAGVGTRGGTAGTLRSEAVTLVVVRPDGANARMVDDAVRARLEARGDRVGPHRLRVVSIDSGDSGAGRASVAACAGLTTRLTADVAADAVLDASPSCLDGDRSALASVGLPVVDADEPPPLPSPEGDGDAALRAEGRAAARLLGDLGMRRVSVLDDGSAVTRDLRGAFEAEAAERDLEVVRLAVDAAGRLTSRGLAPRIRGANADGVYLLVPSAADGAGWVVLDRMHDGGFDGPVVTARRLHVAPPPALRPAVDGLYLTSPDVPPWALTEGDRLQLAVDRLLDAVALSDGTRGGIGRVLPSVTGVGDEAEPSAGSSRPAAPVAILRVGPRRVALDRLISA
jgi:hypothetical protein